MKYLIKIEELAMFLLSLFLFSELDYPCWVYFALILTPDIGMIGYAFNTRLGSLTYNLFHHKAIAICLGFIGYYWSIPTLALIGIILFSHASIDRIFGYGLKFNDNFKHTHLGNL